MKNIIALLLVMVLMIGMCACGTNTSNASNSNEKEEVNTYSNEKEEVNTYAKVTFSDGTTEMFEVGEIPSMVRENQYAYNNKYANNRIEVVTEVTSIGSNYGMAGFVPLEFEGGWNCYLKEDTPVIIDLRNGTLVKITGVLTTDSWSIQEPVVTILE